MISQNNSYIYCIFWENPNMYRREEVIYTRDSNFKFYLQINSFFKYIYSSSLLSAIDNLFYKGWENVFGRERGANLRLEKLLRFSLANDTAALLLEWVLLLWDAFEEDVLFLAGLNVVLDLLTAFRRLQVNRCMCWDDDPTQGRTLIEAWGKKVPESSWNAPEIWITGAKIKRGGKSHWKKGTNGKEVLMYDLIYQQCYNSHIREGFVSL